MEQTYAIELKNITKRFGKIVANDGINLKVKRGEILSLLGENGSGKTTLMNMISGIYFPDEGHILVDGKAVSRASTTDKLAPELEALPALGQTANINMEQLLGLKPDVVLGLENQHKKYESQLQSNNIPAVLFNYDGIKDNVPMLTFLGELTNHQDKAKSVIATYESNIQKVKDVIKNQQPARIAVLRATGKGVTAETDEAVTASMVKELGMTNVVTSHLDGTTKDKTVPYSLETLTADNPDIIFVVTMGKEEEITKAMKKAMSDNPAWANLKAVQNNRVIYLPSKLFLLNPGLQTPEAMARLVKEAYGIDVTF